MDRDHKKAKRLVIFSFLICLCIALACFGTAAYLVVTNRGMETVDENTVYFTKIIVMVGLFFLVLSLGHTLPVLLSARKKSGKAASAVIDFSSVPAETVKASDVFNEANMRHNLAKYIPDGELLLAGIHAMANGSEVNCAFSGCVRMEDRLHPDKDGGIVALMKKKVNSRSIYIGITQNYLVMTDCGVTPYYYQFDDKPNVRETDLQEVTDDILLADIGRCFPLADIQSSDIKNGWLGSVKCRITMKNGSYFKLMFPKLGGLGDGMPHHAQYRDAIIARLKEHNV